ncbi:hypothetical protein GH714_025331 [Hevea brasiliensis]|uniref:Uncharacterized protein n=1 Tax=Hevea brasiliensis TaxID=3981 RepID=A0A6A6M1M0_HEVBR|nr:hypothetical protein GH714_025331 [Hevea brasiliensis]
MEPPVQSTNSGVDTGSESFRESSRGPNSNQRFLLYYLCGKKLKRFKRLTRPENPLLYVHGPRYRAFLDVSTSYDMPVQGAEELPPVKPSYSSHRAERPASILQSADQHVHDVAPLQIVPDNALPPL